MIPQARSAAFCAAKRPRCGLGVWLVVLLPAGWSEAEPPARSYIRDPGFETGSAAWQGVYPEDEAKTVSVFRDHTVAHAGRVSAAVTDRDGEKWEFPNWSQRLETFPRGKWVELSAWVKTASVRYTAQLAVQCWDGKGKKTVGWACTADREKMPGSRDWTRHAVRVFVPAATTAVWVRLGLVGPGTVWFDDVAVTAVGGPAPLASAPAPPGTNLLLNPGFESRKPGPFSQWIAYTYPPRDQRLELTRDEMIFRSGKAAARIMNGNWLNREANHWAQLIAPAPRGRTVRLTGYVKTQNVEGETGFLLQCFDGPLTGRPKLLAESSTHLEHNLTGSTDWTPVSTTLKVPEQTMQLWVRAFLRGVGTAWFDDVQVVVEE